MSVDFCMTEYTKMEPPLSPNEPISEEAASSKSSTNRCSVPIRQDICRLLPLSLFAKRVANCGQPSDLIWPTWEWRLSWLKLSRSAVYYCVWNALLQMASLPFRHFRCRVFHTTDKTLLNVLIQYMGNLIEKFLFLFLDEMCVLPVQLQMG